jgi:hypothetical protein
VIDVVTLEWKQSDFLVIILLGTHGWIIAGRNMVLTACDIECFMTLHFVDQLCVQNGTGKKAQPTKTPILE